MEKLVSKIHYNTFEKGEYTAEEPRTYAETIQLIEDYPWSTQRQLADVQLTCPSITLQRNPDSYLRIGPYFGSKYCIYTFENGDVFEKVFNQLEDTFETIQLYYLEKDTTTGFEKKHLLINPKSDFVTNDFVYAITGNRIFRFLFFPEIYTFLLFAVLPILMVFKANNWSHIWLGMGMMVFVLLLNGCNFYLFINYYRYSKNKIIKISEGTDTFYYGDQENYTAYNKSEISNINIQLNKNYKSLWREYNVFIIEFKDGREIRFPSLLLKQMEFSRKFADIPIHHQYRYLATI